MEGKEEEVEVETEEVKQLFVDGVEKEEGDVE